MSKNVWGLLLWLIFSFQLILAMIAEHNEEYTKAIYEMMWAGLFVYLLHEEKNE